MLFKIKIGGEQVESKEELFNEIYLRMHLSSIEEKIRKDIVSYLNGESEQIVLPKVQYQVDNFLFYLLANYIDTEQGDLAKRGYYAASLLDIPGLIRRNRYRNERYELYHKVGIDKDIVIEDVSSTISNLLNSSPRDILSFLQKEISNFNLKEKSLLGSLMKCYGEEIRVYFKAKEGKEGSEAEIILGHALSITAGSQESEKRERAIRRLEEDLLMILPKLYSTQELEAACETYLPSTSEVIKSICHKGRGVFTNHEKEKSVLIKGQAKILKKLTLAVGMTFYKESHKLSDILKVQMGLTGAYSCEQMFMNFGIEEASKMLSELIETLKMPMAFGTGYYSEKMLRRPFSEEGAWYEKKLRSLYDEDVLAFKEAFESLKQTKQIGALTLFALLRKYGEPMDERNIGDLEAILPFTANEEINKWQRNKNCQEYQGPLALYEVSKEARAYISKALADEALINILTNLEAASQLFYTEVKGNILEEATRYFDVKVLIEVGVERENGLSKTVLLDFIKLHLKEADEVLREKIEAGKDVVMKYMTLLYTNPIGMKDETLVQGFNHRLKSVINFMEDFVKDREEQVRGEFENLRKVKNKNMQEALQRLEKRWDAQKCAAYIASLQSLEEVAKYIEAVYNPSNDKFIPYLDQVFFSDIKDKEGAIVPAIVLKYYLSEYMLLKEIYVIEACECIKTFISTKALQSLTRSLYELWLQDGADTKQKNVILLYALNGGPEDITKLKKQIDDWTEHSRGALAAFAVTSMAMNGSNLALMLTDSIGHKYKNKQVKGAAQAAMDYVAQVRGVSKETLADRIVPTLGFNTNREIILNYGSRSFKGILTPELEVLLYDPNSKQIKSLPKPNKEDDLEQAEVAKETFKGLKKQVKIVITAQKLRLSKAIMTGRRWNREDWQRLFVENPIMNGFAMSLIWAECDQEGTIRGTFRYMEDGSLNTVEEEEYSVGEESFITLVHPIELEPEVISAWKQQLEDYEVVQSIEQLALPCYTLTEEEKRAKSITRFKDKKVYFGTILGMMDKYEWQKTSIVDGGGYEGYYFEDEVSGIGIKLNLDMVFIGIEATAEVKLQEMLFYKKGTIEYGSYRYNDVTDKNCIVPLQVPAKILSFALMIGELIVAKEIEG